MEYDDWAPTYDRIRTEFGFPFDREQRSARRLRELLPRPALLYPLDRLRPRVAGREAVICGLAPHVGPPPIWQLPRRDRPPALLAADGATLACLEAGLVPDVVVTDLDGPVAAEVSANARGSLTLVHAHGDNLDALERWVPEFGGELAGSWAGAPGGGLLNVGGFTDGDRAAYLAEHLGSQRILLWAFDFEHPAEGPDAAVKRSKLRWAERLLAELSERGRTPLARWAPDGSIHPYGPGGPGTSTQ